MPQTEMYWKRGILTREESKTKLRMYAEKIERITVEPQSSLTLKHCHSIRSTQAGNGFAQLLEGMSFRLHKRKLIKGTQFRFQTDMFASLKYECAIKLKVFKTYVVEGGQHKEVRILDELFSSDSADQLEMYSVEMTARCSDNEMKRHCKAFSDFAKKFKGFVDLQPTTQELIPSKPTQEDSDE